MIVFRCSECNAPMRAAKEHAGLSVNCPSCKATVVIPASSTDAITGDSGSAGPPPPTSVTSREQERLPERDDYEEAPRRRRYDDGDLDEDDDMDIRRSRRYEDGPVPSYLAQAIMCTLCCCWPLGIVAIVHAAQVNSHLSRGDYELAVRTSDNAKLWCWISFGLGLVAYGGYVAINILGGAMRF